jgi:hypothetical protein
MLEDLRFLSNEIVSSFEVFTEVELRIPLFCDMLYVCGKLDREHSGQRSGLLCEGRVIKEEIMDISLLNVWAGSTSPRKAGIRLRSNARYYQE